MRFLIIFIFLITNVVAEELPGIKNIVIHKIPKTHDNVIFLDKNDQKININEYTGNLLILNFWATWCEPCKKEMPSLDKLKTLNEFKNINIIPINIGGESYKKSKEFFDKIKIKNLDIFTGSGPEFSQIFKLRGLPTTILIDQNGFEVGRIVGYIDFNDQSLLDWLPKIL